MWRSLVLTLGLLLLLPAAWAQEKSKEKSKDPPKKLAPQAEKPKLSVAGEQLQAAEAEMRKERAEIVNKYRAAKTDEEREKLRDEYFKTVPQKYAPRFLELAEKHADDPVAFRALTWLVANAGETPEAGKAVDQIAQKHLANPGLLGVCQQLSRGGSPAGAKLLRAVLEKSSDKNLQGWACYGLAKNLAERAEGDEKLQAEAEQLFERVSKDKDFASLRGGRETLGKMAEGELFVLKHLAVGKVAPEIEGEDIGGTKFKLSEYRGKVVVLDFWGHW